MTDAKRAAELDIMDRGAVLHPNTPLSIHQQQGGMVEKSADTVHNTSTS